MLDAAERVSSVDDVLTAVGGMKAAAELAKVTSPAPYNWKTRGIIPAEHFLVFAEALARLGKEADPAIFGIKERDQ